MHTSATWPHLLVMPAKQSLQAVIKCVRLLHVSAVQRCSRELSPMCLPHSLQGVPVTR